MYIETERLILRELTEADFPALSAVLCDPENMHFYPKPFDAARVHRWIEWCIQSYAEHGFGLYAVCLRETGELIGDCGLSMQCIDGRQLPEIGYHIRRDLHRRGYAREAAAAVRDRAFRTTDFPALYSYCESENVPSFRTAESIGMRPHSDYIDEHGVPHHVSVIRYADWPRLHFVPATGNDRAAVVALYDSVKRRPFSVWSDDYPGLPEIDADLAADNLFLLKAEDRPIGAISINTEREAEGAAPWRCRDRVGEISRACIASEHQGRGLSALLLSGIEAELLRRGCRAVHLLVAPGNTPAYRCYLSHGYEVRGACHLFGLDFLACEKLLSEELQDA